MCCASLIKVRVSEFYYNFDSGSKFFCLYSNFATLFHSAACTPPHNYNSWPTCFALLSTAAFFRPYVLFSLMTDYSRAQRISVLIFFHVEFGDLILPMISVRNIGAVLISLLVVCWYIRSCICFGFQDWWFLSVLHNYELYYNNNNYQSSQLRH